MDRNNRVDPLYSIIRMTLACEDVRHCYAARSCLLCYWDIYLICSTHQSYMIDKLYKIWRATVLYKYLIHSEGNIIVEHVQCDIPAERGGGMIVEIARLHSLSDVVGVQRVRLRSVRGDQTAVRFCESRRAPVPVSRRIAAGRRHRRFSRHSYNTGN